MSQPVEIADLRATDVAKRLGISRSYVHDLIKGNKVPSLTVAAQIEREFGVPVAAWIARIPDSNPTGQAA